MEEENRKARRAARREWVETVRELAAFVKKRDKRLARFQADEALRRAERAAAAAAKRAEEKAARAAAAAAYVEPEWVRASEAAAAAAQDSDGGEDEGEEEEQQEFFCVACDKRFRSAGQLASHEVGGDGVAAGDPLRAPCFQQGLALALGWAFAS